MIAPRIHGLSKECCRPPLRGTTAGFVQHHRERSPLCPPCYTARRAYITAQAEHWAAFEPATRPQQGMKAFAEDYLWLITTGETHPETIATRLGTNRRALERRLLRIGLHVLHLPRTLSGAERKTATPTLAVAA